ncbi:hypothetical protein [Sinisalibacter aestuarii]|uniref:Sulfotransferase family protein n=1 Tax=Sinisalibacter aestuarii TaxID=2949426 RepID=A0ABQ5LMB8_9RHOB|nr:hypothetical protein [Sinisalibacter aestuarii]GKY86164.1 hypothetical protein STA1M1_00330 [Sinisalibacter aestuarii]
MAASTGITDRRVILHLGVQKTASTALHHFLKRNEEALAPHLMVRTPRQGTPTQRMGRAAVDYSLEPTPEREAAFVACIRELRDEILADDRPVLVSHENLPGAMLGNPGVTTLYPMIGQLLALLDAHLAPLVPHYVLYTRDMAAWKRSAYNQSVKTDGYPRSFEAFLTETAECGTWEGLSARIAAQIGASRFTRFRLEDEADQLRPGQQLLTLAGLDAATLAALDPIAHRPNESLAPGALEFMRLVNETGLAPGPRMKVMRLVMNNPALFAPDPDRAQSREART